jgi:hypothetical protein
MDLIVAEFSMVQFYFLSIILNLSGGYALVAGGLPPRSRTIEGFREFFEDPIVRLVLGILALATAALKFLTPIRGDIPIVGDFLPAVGGLGVGFTLILERYHEGDAPASPAAPSPSPEPSSPSESEAAAKSAKSRVSPRGAPNAFERLFLDHKSVIGLVGIIAGVVHFLFPMVIFL